MPDSDRPDCFDGDEYLLPFGYFFPKASLHENNLLSIGLQHGLHLPAPSQYADIFWL